MKEMNGMSMPGTTASLLDRAEWMRVLALSRLPDLEAAMMALGPVPASDWLRKPETGMTMVQGRSGGTGARFNLGEMTVTRCALTLRAAASGDTFDAVSPDSAPAPPLPAHDIDTPCVGIAYVQGRSARHAEHAALADALLQLPGWHAMVQSTVIAPLRAARETRLTQRAAAAAQTRVDFFTMDRGENPDD